MKETYMDSATNSLYCDVCGIIDRGRQQAYSAVSHTMIETYWQIGKRIVEEEQQGKARAEYGEKVIDGLANHLTLHYGKGFSTRYLRSFRKFYLIAGDYQIWKSRFPNLTWTHIFKSLRVDDETAIGIVLCSETSKDIRRDRMEWKEPTNPASITWSIYTCSSNCMTIIH